MIIVYLRDGSGYGALDYWLQNNRLHIETTYSAEKSFPIDQVDLERTMKENAARGFRFALYAAPLTSDPGRLFAPDSYAPPCSPSSNSPQPGTPVTPSSAGPRDAGSRFGAIGSGSERGLAVNFVIPDSPAAQIGIRSGDIVERINCQRIRSTQDIEFAVSNSSGPIWVSYLIQGTWLTEKKTIVP